MRFFTVASIIVSAYVGWNMPIWIHPLSLAIASSAMSGLVLGSLGVVLDLVVDRLFDID